MLSGQINIPDILDENPAFRDSFFSELEKLGLKLK